MKFLIILLTLIIFIFTLSNVYINYYIPKLQGLKGLKGDKGEKGDKGNQGLIGYQGSRGYTGKIGPKGKDVGLIGIMGNQGKRGLTGDIGDKGFTGLKGEKGEKGPPGIRGLQGYSGKKGLKGPNGKPREISDYNSQINSFTNINPIKIAADKTKCVQVYSNINNNEIKCPENMAIFDIRAKKISSKTQDSEIDKIICCNFDLENKFNQIYFNKVNLLIQLNVELNLINNEINNFEKFIPEAKYKFVLKNYNKEQRNKILNNSNSIRTLLLNIKNKKSIREMPIKNLEILLGDNNLAKQIKIYNKEEINKIKLDHESITSYEFYILNLISGLITKKIRKQENPIETTDYSRLIKEIYDFPKNNITELEKKVNLYSYK